jgi:hypothetical protein
VPTNATDLKAEFQRRGPWVTRFVVGSEAYGGDYDAASDERLGQFFESFPGARTILELGSLEGGHTLQLAQRAGVQRVLGIEGRQASIDRARYAQSLLEVSNVEFMQANLERLNLSRLGQFDVVFCVGILYHMPQPWKLIDKMAHISAGLFVWTHYVQDDQARDMPNGFKGLTINESGPSDPLSGLSRKCFWPTFDSLLAMLRKYGFMSVRLINKDPKHPHGPAVTLAATKP